MRRQAGFNLIELMVGVSILAFLLAAGAPSFTRWLQDAQNRTAAESVLNGLQLARVESLRRNTLVRFNLTDASGKVAWSVGCVVVTPDCPASIQSRDGQEGGRNARLGVARDAIPRPPGAGYFSNALSAGTGLGTTTGTSGAPGVTFDGTGRAPRATGGRDITRIDITNAALAEARRYVLTISPGGQVRMCDPALNFSSNSQGCS